MVPLEVFFSYCHADERYRKQIETHLSALKRQGMISDWSDHKILPGSNLDAEIAAHLESANIILLLISPAFIASDYCYATELKLAIDRHNAGTARVIPIIARPCDWHSLPFGNLKALPQDGKPITKWSLRDDAYANIAVSLRKVVDELQKALSAKVAPSASLPEPDKSSDTDAVRLACEVFSDRDDTTLRKFGCPCLVVRLTCRSKRPAKIAEIKLHVRGPHILSAFQEAFSTDLGYGPGRVQFIEEPSFTLSFIALAKPNTTNGYIVEEDDRMDFVFPSFRGMLLSFAEAPPDDVFLTVEYLNGEVDKLVSGTQVQSPIPDLIRWCMDYPFTPHPMLTLKMGMNVKATGLPDSPTRSFLNDETLLFPPHPRRDIPVDEVSDHIRFRSKVLRVGGEKDLASEDWLIDLVRTHNNIDVRRDAIISLRRLLTPKVRVFFADLLATEFNENTREMIIRSFGLVGTPEDLPIMERLAKSEASRFCRDAATFACRLLNHRFAK